ncbi:hypothetical protein [Nannocystis punicea]|uniref:Uncharacterized protein n=1 Tax=Nannocystis punicea TaxID=2995304 RepID=A0ABY7HBF0_9BACT|nr:hypothetical protein [Nannocystis poenicansa]WAS96379.1 hypothetical protein O0S08_09480 [Nannocystis poenicansa]
MRIHSIIPARELEPGLATIVVRIPGQATLRSRAVMVQHHDYGVVQVAFASGHILSLSDRTMVGRIVNCTVRTSRRDTSQRGTQ